MYLTGLQTVYGWIYKSALVKTLRKSLPDTIVIRRQQHTKDNNKFYEIGFLHSYLTNKLN